MYLFCVSVKNKSKLYLIFIVNASKLLVWYVSDWFKRFYESLGVLFAEGTSKLFRSKLCDGM